MSYNKESVVGVLNDLLTRHYDAEQGFMEAANQVNRADLNNWFRKKSAQHNKFGHEIKAHILSLGGTPDKGTSFLGELHQIWMDMKRAFNENDPVVILEECERGEGRTREDYEKAISEIKNGPEATRLMLLRHQEEIRTNVEAIKALQRMYVPEEV